jgi:hypothetical protein
MGMIWIRKAFVLAGLAVLLGALVPASATAVGGCVSRPEYRHVDIGMRKARVHDIFGTPGERIDQGPNSEERSYDICPEYQGVVVFVRYEDNRVTGKEWLLGE